MVMVDTTAGTSEVTGVKLLLTSTPGLRRAVSSAEALIRGSELDDRATGTSEHWETYLEVWGEGEGGGKLVKW